ncbi:hypothetical protein ASZ78_011179, partial [Callipepla squamata]
MTAVLETDFGLRVTYDWNWHLVLDLPSSYSEQTCGLCGNFNLQPGDDIPLRGGDKLAASIVSWASTWKVPDEDPFCWDFCDGDCPVCEEEKRELYSGNQHCGLIKKSFQGPFRACHDVVSPRDFFQNCLYDVCMSGGAKKILCKTLETYASTCRKNGAVVHDWRTPAGCPLPCPEHSHYESCGSACPSTCTHRDAPSSCTRPCVETCACDPGYVLSGAQCVPSQSCGCTRDGRYYAPGEEFWEDEMCRSRCRCDAELGMVVCHEGSCKAGEQCRVVGGVRRCVAVGRSVCVATGDPHYTTFDGRRFDFMGTCVYRFAALCSDDPTLVPFDVTVENNHRGSRAVSYTKEVTLKVYNVTFSLSQAEPKKMKVWKKGGGRRGPVCPPNHHYELCGSSCPSSCPNQEQDDGCDPSSPCTEGCFCDPGFIQSGDLCVPAPRCGCSHDGRYLQRGEEFYPTEDCGERCVCGEDGEVRCEPWSCGAKEGCEVRDGARGCYPEGCGRCEVLGAAVLRTFDGVLLPFAGSCTYTLAEVGEEEEEEEEVEAVLVRVQKEMSGEEPMVRQLTVMVRGVTVAMQRGVRGEVKVDGERHLLPVSLSSGAVTVTQEGIHRVLRTRMGLKLLYDGAAYVLLTLPGSYRGRPGGLCGDFDGDVTDDDTDPQRLGEAWGIPTRGVGAGHDGDTVCQSLQAYAAACQAAGGQLREWREEAQCREWG